MFSGFLFVYTLFYWILSCFHTGTRAFLSPQEAHGSIIVALKVLWRNTLVQTLCIYYLMSARDVLPVARAASLVLFFACVIRCRCTCTVSPGQRKNWMHEVVPSKSRANWFRLYVTHLYSISVASVARLDGAGSDTYTSS